MSDFIITREYAICIFFGVEYNPIVAYNNLMQIEKFGILEVGYERGAPNKPMLLPKHKINSEPNRYFLYPPRKITKLDLLKFKLGKSL